MHDYCQKHGDIFALIRLDVIDKQYLSYHVDTLGRGSVKDFGKQTVLGKEGDVSGHCRDKIVQSQGFTLLHKLQNHLASLMKALLP